MTKSLLLCLLLMAFILGCRPEEQAGTTQTPALSTQANSPAPSAQPAPAGPALPMGKQELVLTVILPPSGEKLAPSAVSGHGPNCPQSAISALLGAEIVSPHGMVLGRVFPDGLAAKAGLKPGDSIVKCDGVEVTCPRTFLPYMERRDTPREVKLTVLRAGEEAKTPTAPSPSRSDQETAK